MVDASMMENERVQEHEEPWTDARIRWTDDNGGPQTVETEQGEEEETAFMDPFQDPNPMETLNFSFVHPLAKHTDDYEQGNIIELELRGYKKDSDQVWQSTGLTLWRASQHLCNYMMEHADMFQNKRVLELGAGLGLCGILAYRLGRSSVVCITDGDSDALVLLRENIRRNKARASLSFTEHDRQEHSNSRSRTAVYAHQLIWGHESTQKFLTKQNNGDNPTSSTFDVLIASDIIYALVIVKPLWETVKLLLDRTETAVFVMAYAKRDVPVTIDMVLDAADEAGFSYELVSEEVENGADYGNGEDGHSWVYEFRWKRVELLSRP